MILLIVMAQTLLPLLEVFFAKLPYMNTEVPGVTTLIVADTTAWIDIVV